MLEDYRGLNQTMWDERAAAHAASPDYRVQRYIAEPDLISDVVAFDRPRLGDLAGLHVIHLQCHIGTDTLSLARLGASVTGLDFSSASIEQAQALAAAAGTAIEFHVGDVYAAAELAGEARFDLVYTGIGALCWLPDLPRWAEVVATLLKPGGRLLIRDGHPVMLSLDLDRTDDQLRVAFPYFHRPDPIVWDEPGTYVASDVEFVHTRAAEWAHPLSEIVQSVIDAGLRVTELAEHQSLPWRALPSMVPGDDGEYRLPDRPERLPLSFTLQAVRDGKSPEEV